MRIIGTPALLQSVGLNALPFTRWQTEPKGFLGRLTSASLQFLHALLNLRLQLARAERRWRSRTGAAVHNGARIHFNMSSNSFMPVVISFSNAARFFRISPGGRCATSAW